MKKPGDRHFKMRCPRCGAAAVVYHTDGLERNVRCKAVECGHRFKVILEVGPVGGGMQGMAGVNARRIGVAH